MLRRLPRPRGAVGFERFDDLLSHTRRLVSPEREAGGVVGDGWLTLTSGEATAVTATVGMFTWHRHPSGAARFSVGDFATFRIIGGRWHLLATPTDWCVYEVLGPPRVKVPRIDTGCPPTLRKRRLDRWAESVFGLRAEDIGDDRLCLAFGLARRPGSMRTRAVAVEEMAIGGAGLRGA